MYLGMGLAILLLIPLVILSGKEMSWYYLLIYGCYLSIFIYIVNLSFLCILEWDLNNAGKLIGITKWISALLAVANACDYQNLWLPVTIFLLFLIYFYKESKRIKELSLSSQSTSENEIDPLKSIYPKDD